MNKEEENIDNLFKQEANSSAANQYDEKYWDEYVQFKKGYYNSKKWKRIVPFFFLLFLFIGGLGIYYFNTNTQLENVGNVDKTLNKDYITNNQLKNTQNKNSIETLVSNEQKNANQSIKNKNLQEDSENQLKNNALSKTKDKINVNSIDNKLAKSEVSQPKKEKKSNYIANQTSNDVNDVLNEKELESSQVNTTTSDKIKSSEGNNDAVISDSKKSFVTSNLASSTNSPNTIVENLNNNTNYELLAITPNIKDLINYTFLGIDTNLFYTESEDSNLQKFHTPYSSISILGGIFTGKNYNDSKLYLGIMAGGKYYYNFSKEWNASIGLNLQFKHTNNSNFIQTNYQYDLGYREQQLINSFNNFVFIEAPLVINYSINTKHTIGIQASYFYLAGFENKKTNANSLFLGAESSTFSESKTEKGYWDIFNRTDYGIGLNYGYNLNKKLSLNVGYLYGLTDVSNNNYILNFDRNNQLKFWLEYKF